MSDREIRSVLGQCRENSCKVTKTLAQLPMCFRVLRKLEADREAVAYLAEEISKQSVGKGALSLPATHSKSKRK